MIEKRMHPRFNIPLSIEVGGLEEEEFKPQTTRIEDISIGGARFGISGDVEVGSEFQISLEDRKSDFANALGLVTSDSGPLTFRMHARVLRADPGTEDSTLKKVAVEFCSPLRIAPISA